MMVATVHLIIKPLSAISDYGLGHLWRRYVHLHSNRHYRDRGGHQVSTNFSLRRHICASIYNGNTRALLAPGVLSV